MAPSALADGLKHLLDQRGVDIAVHSALVELGLVTIGTFAWLGDDVASVREALSSPPFDMDFKAEGLAPGDKVKARAAQAKMLDAWQGAKARTEEKQKVEATQRASSLPLTVPVGDLVGLRRAHEAIAGRLDDEIFPSSAVIERRLQEVEQGNLQAESLQDVGSVAEVPVDMGGLALNPDGTFRLKRAAKQVPLPSDSEELRRRIRTLDVSFEIARIQNPNRQWLATQALGPWALHVEYVLGPKVYGLRFGPNASGVKPPWHCVLEYEWALRKEAMRAVVYDGKDLAEALSSARADTELREGKFITPLLVASNTGAGVSSFASSLSASRAAPPSHPYSA